MSKGPILSDRLKNYVERVEKLNEEIKAIMGDRRDVFSEAKGVGYDIKTMRRVIALRALDEADRAEQQTLLDTYLHALGMVDRIEERLEAGDSVRAAAVAVGASKSTVHRVSQKREIAGIGTATPPHDSETGEIQESCGGDSHESPGHVGLTAGTQHGASGAERACPESAPAGVAPGPQDTDPWEAADESFARLQAMKRERGIGVAPDGAADPGQRIIALETV